MTIILNGEAYVLREPRTIAALLTDLNLDSRRVAVERNFLIVKRQAYEEIELSDGDQVEIVNFVGGG